MMRAEFPVDTHVHRIAKDILKWIRPGDSREEAYEHLNAVVPDGCKLELHCLLIAHGRQCHRCAARGKPQFPPKDGTKLECPLVDLNKTRANLKKQQQYTVDYSKASAKPELVVSVKPEKILSTNEEDKGGTS
eukprot:Sro292_g109650.2  (133) ;mRNA; f:55186-55584